MENKNIKTDIICLEGIVTEALPSARFKITLDNGRIALGHISAKIRKHKLRILVGDKVLVESLIQEFKNENEYICRIIKRLKISE